MVVSREKAAVKWMNTVFDDICDKLQMEGWLSFGEDIFSAKIFVMPGCLHRLARV